MLKRVSPCFGVVGTFLLCLVLVGIAQARSADHDNAALVHVGLNPASCATIPGAHSGMVHVSVFRRRFRVQVSVHDALPDTTYVVDIRCVGAIGSLTSDSEGTATAQIELPRSALPASGFFIDISVANGGGGAGNYGDTFIAGPFALN